MARHIGRTILQYGLVLFAAVCLNFALPRLAPGDPVDFLLPPELAGSLSPAERTSVLAQFGLDDPLPVQFGRYVEGLTQANFGYSVRFGRPVRELLVERLPWTLLLVGSSVVLSLVIGALAGFAAGWRRGSKSDISSLSGFMLIDSMPPFFIAMLLILFFSVYLGLFPIFGAIPVLAAGGLGLFAEVAKRLILPLAALTLASLGTAFLVARSALISELQEDYVFMAEAKGLSPKKVRKHAERNALLPLSTVALLSIGHIVGGATVVETVFSYPGLGRLIYDSVLSRDYPVLQGAFFLLAVTVVVANIVADLFLPVLDPRVRKPRTA